MQMLPRSPSVCYLRAAESTFRVQLCRATASSPRSSSSSSSSSSSQASCIRGPPCFTLEASVGAANPLDLQLLSTGPFGAEVHPDLPIATTWHGLYKQLTLKFGGGAARKEAAAAAATSITAAAAAAVMSESAAEAEAALAFAGARPVMHIATVGAQLRTLEDTAEAMCWAAGVTPSGCKLEEDDSRPHADALLLVSGSHPVRQLPMASQLLPGSVKMLQRGMQLKQQGVLPQQLELWAVANPVIEQDASYTEQKVAAGAQVILTQPPLDWPAFERWMDDARRRGLHEAARLLIGFPCLSSSSNCGFWLALCNAGNNAEGKRIQQQFAAAEADAQQQHRQQPANGSSKVIRPPADAFMQQWNRQLLSKLQNTAGVSGLHVMPITKPSKRLALQLVQEGAFGPAAWPLATVRKAPAEQASAS